MVLLYEEVTLCLIIQHFYLEFNNILLRLFVMAKVIYLGDESTKFVNSDTYSYISVCKALKKDLTFTATGEGQTLELAIQDAKSKLREFLLRVPDNPQDELNTTHIEPMNSERMTNMNNNAGGGNKRITERQMNYIIRLSANSGISGEQKACELFGKRLDELNGSEANTLIKSLKINRN